MKIYEIYSPDGKLVKVIKAEGIYNNGSFQILRNSDREPVAVVPSGWCVIESKN